MDAAVEELLLNDDQFTGEIRKTINSFLVHHFDPQKYAREVLQHSTLSLTEHLSLIEISIAALDHSLKSQIRDDPDQLFSNVTPISQLETTLKDLHTSSSGLLVSTGTCRDSFRGIYTEYAARLDACEKSKVAVDMLRKAARISQIAKRLRSCMDEDKEDFGRAAVLVTDMGDLYTDVDLLSLKFVATDLDYVAAVAGSLPRKIIESLSDAVKTQNLRKLGQAVDACLVFENAEEILTQVTCKLIGNVRGLISDGLNIQQLAQSDAGRSTGNKSLPGRTTLPSSLNTPALRTSFWIRVDGIFDLIYQNQIRIELMESVYLGRFEQHAMYLCDSPEVEEGRISMSFFKKMVEALETELAKCGKESSFLQQILENEFPRLLKMVKETTNRLRSATLFLQGPQLDTLRCAVSRFQSLFVSRSLSRLLDPVNIAFGDSVVLTTTNDLGGIFRSITNELVVCSADEALALLLCGNIGRALRLVFVRLESLIETDGEVTQVTGNLTPKQVRNIHVVDTAYQVKAGVERLLKNNKGALPEAARQIIEDTLVAHEGPVQVFLQPLTNSLIDSVEAILLSMHDEDFSAGQEESDFETMEMLDSTCSSYMKELQDFLSRSHQTFFLRLDTSQPFTRSSLVRFARRCLELFVRHVSLLRPVGKHGRLKLAGDFAQLEAALAPLNFKSLDYGREMQLLKAFRPLLFQSPLQISANLSVGSTVPYSVALHHLFSRAPTDFQSPYSVLGWSISRYCKYLDEKSSESDRLALVSGCLDAYAHAVIEKGQTHYAVIYPIMRDLLAKALLHEMAV